MPHTHNTSTPGTQNTGPAWHGFVIALGCGLLFGLGLTLSGMSDPLTVQAFLDVAGDWNPSLAFVMGGAVVVSLLGFQWLLKRRQAPVCGTVFHVPQNKAIDARLLRGAALFGIGWGLSGYCPGPALTSLLAGNAEVWLFVPAMLAGAWLQRQTSRH
ncbi:YeeE/YedE family protein [Aquabacterium sp.]|uniref:YeeE/YedE family protein n=1 Tax=Aquabacterium sp. TaxID=1872578 RepID=UPI002488B1E5|nr:YeeE/YedE family protein [Aquabacterium sp.]MDI1348151.1 YeeE/YedE family protein [Aquabacterium sp.]